MNKSLGCKYTLSVANQQESAGSWAACFALADPEAHRPQYLREHRAILEVLIDRVVPVRIGFGKYRVDITWTHVGQTLANALEIRLAA